VRGDELAEVQARLQHVITTDNPALMLEPEALAEAGRRAGRGTGSLTR
jgi:hypothetical protein